MLNKSRNNNLKHGYYSFVSANILLQVHGVCLHCFSLQSIEYCISWRFYQCFYF